MRVALVTQKFGRGGGQERWTESFATALHERGWEVHVVTRCILPSDAVFPFRIHYVPSVARDPFRFAIEAQRLLAEIQPEVVHDMGDGWGGDLLHYHGGPYPLLAERKLAALSPMCQLLKRWAWRVLPHYRRRYWFAREQGRRHPGLVIALSRYQAGQIPNLLGVPKERIRVIYNGVDIVRFSPANKVLFREAVRDYLGVDRSVTLFLVVANHFALKGVPQLIRAVAELSKKEKRVHLLVLGRRKGLAGWMARQGFRGGIPVTFLGWVDDPTPFYAAADVYVHPTFYDSCSLAVLEALATGIPVITTRYNGAGEIMEDGREGFVLPDPKDVRALREKLEMLLSPQLRKEMGVFAREKAMLFRFERNVDEILHLYGEITGLRPIGNTHSLHFPSSLSIGVGAAFLRGKHLPEREATA